MDFYYIGLSPPCRAVMLTAKALGVPLNKKLVELFKGDHLKPDFVALNPQHCVPTIVLEKDFVMWESRPIMMYLVTKYGKDDSLYPKDLKKRALIDRLLYFDMGTLFTRAGKYFAPVMFGRGPSDPADLEKLQEALGWLEGFLTGQDFAAGDHITIADHSLIASITHLEPFNVDLSNYPNIVAWKQRCSEQMPGFATENTAGIEQLRQMIEQKNK